MMKSRAIAMHEIYTENDALIDEILIPFLNHPELFSEDHFSTVFTWLKKMYYGDYDEPFFLRRLCLALIPHYEEKDAVEDLLFLYICAGYANLEITKTVEPEAGKWAVNYYKKVLSYREQIDTFENPLSRDYIFIAYSNLIRVAPTLGLISLEEANDLFSDLLDMRTREKFCRYDETNPRIPLLVKNAISSFYNCPIILDLSGLCEDSPIRKQLAERVKKHYPQRLKKLGSIYQCNTDLVFHYHLIMGREGLMSWDKVWMILDDFYLYQLKHHRQNMNADRNALYLNYPLNLLEALQKSSLPMDIKYAKCKFYRDTTAQYVKMAAAGFNSYDLNFAIQRFVFHPLLLQSFENRRDRENYIYHMVICRHFNTFTHSVMVAKITDVLLSYTLTYRPDLLAGFAEPILTSEDALLHKNEICDYIHRSALLHDIGKNAMTDIINTQYRRLSDYTFSIIKKHPEKGAEYLSRHKDFLMYQDVALGHHLSYDGKSGYPSTFDKSSSKLRIAIDFVRISDCLDAATDTLSRYYHRSKSFAEVMEEFRAGSGTLYHPEIVQLIFDHPDLYRALELMTSEHREDIYYEIYQTFIKKE